MTSWTVMDYKKRNHRMGASSLGTLKIRLNQENFNELKKPFAMIFAADKVIIKMDPDDLNMAIAIGDVKPAKKSNVKSDPVHHPSHYSWRGGMEAADIVAEMTRGAEGAEAYWLGCAIKYLYRYPKKNGLQDIEKAIECLQRLRAIVAKKVKDGNALE